MHRFLTSSLGVTAGALLLTAAVPSGAAAHTPPSCHGSRALPAVSVTSGRAPRVRGSVRVTAPGGRSGQALVQFCARVSAVQAPVTLVSVRPGGISIRLAKAQRLSLVSATGRTTATVTVHASGAPIKMLLDAHAKRASLFVDGARTGSATAPLATVTRVYVGPAGAQSAAPFLAKAASAAPATTTVSATSQTTTTTAAGKTTAAPVKTTAAATSSTNTTATTTTATPATGTTTTPAAVTGITAAVAGGASVWPSVNPFSPTSFWNTPIAATAPLDANSATYVSDLQSQIKQSGVWMNTTAYSVPAYVVPAGQPTVSVTLDTWGPDLQQQFNAVPIPAGAVAASGTDESMSVWQPSTNKLWDFWLMHQVNGVWHARWGGEMDNVSTNPGYFTHSGQTNNWGGTATGLPLIGGLITLADLQRGYINHALALAVPQTLQGAFRWPAQRGDGNSTAATALPEGIRFRLDPTVNVSTLGLPWLDRLIAQAAQTYGIVLRDTSGAVTLYGQDPTPTGTNPWAAPFDGWSAGTYLSWLPWSRMQVVAPPQ